MFYLSKRLETLVNRYPVLHKPPGEPRRSKAGFWLEQGYGGEVVETFGGLVPKALLKNGNGYAYVVGYGLDRISELERTYAEMAKGSVVDELAGSGEGIGIGLLDSARQTARRSLLTRMGEGRAEFLSYLIAHDTVGYGPLSILMEDRKRIEEIEVNAPSAPIAIFHADYGRCATNLRFDGERSFRHSLNRLVYEADKELGEETPIIDAQVGNARVHAQIAPYAQSGAVASIRLADNRLVGFDYLLRRGTTDVSVLAYLWLAMDAGMNILIAGSPASGKTTLLSALFGFVPRSEKVLTIEEEVNELKIKLDINNSVALYGSGLGGKASTRDQIINALRMRPDRLVIGEVRGAETRDLFSGANLGIPFITTMHSNEGGIEIVKKLMVKPMDVDARSLNCLDLALYMKHVGLSKRVLGEVYEYRWLSRAETEGIGTVIEGNDSVDVGCIVSGGKLDFGALRGSKVIAAYSRKAGVSGALALGEVERRGEFLRILTESCTGSREILDRLQGYECA